MNIRKIEPTESLEYVDALNHLIRTTINLPAPAIEQYCLQWSEDRISKSLNDWVFLIQKTNNQINGILLGTPPEGGVGTIIWVLVDKNNQGKGIGKELFKAACDEYKSKGAHKVKLTVPDENTVNFYQKQGMKLEGIHRNHWWKADFWAMGKELN